MKATNRSLTISGIMRQTKSLSHWLECEKWPAFLPRTLTFVAVPIHWEMADLLLRMLEKHMVMMVVVVGKTITAITETSLTTAKTSVHSFASLKYGHIHRDIPMVLTYIVTSYGTRCTPASRDHFKTFMK